MKRQLIDKINRLNLSVFEQKLQLMAQEGKLDAVKVTGHDELTDIKSVPLSDEDRTLFLSTIKKASHENTLLKASKEVRKAELPFGRHLQSIRDKSGLSQADIASLLSKPISYIDKVENGQVNPTTMLVDDLADIMQLFRLTLTDLKTSISAFFALSSKPTSRIGAMARSSIKAGTKERGENLAHALDAARQAIAKKNQENRQEKAEINPEFLGNIKKVLTERGQKDLLV